MNVHGLSCCPLTAARAPERCASVARPAWPAAVVDRAVTDHWLRGFLDLECFILSGMTAKDTIAAGGRQPAGCFVLTLHGGGGAAAAVHVAAPRAQCGSRNPWRRGSCMCLHVSKASRRTRYRLPHAPLQRWPSCSTSATTARQPSTTPRAAAGPSWTRWSGVRFGVAGLWAGSVLRVGGLGRLWRMSAPPARCEDATAGPLPRVCMCKQQGAT